MEGEGSRWRSGLLEQLVRFLRGRRRITEVEIQEIMDAGEEEGLINEEENAMIRSIFTLGDTVVREIMVPRTDMACVSADESIREVLSTINNCGHSRIPVFDGTMDNIIGIIYAKDLLRLWGTDHSVIDLRALVRHPYFIPESKNLEELLQEFKRKQVHIAIVIDEYGGTSGLVTIEDVLEQIVGDIQDEYDREEEWLIQESADTVLVDARLPIEELERCLDRQIERDKFDTVGGLIVHLTGRIPPAGETVTSNGLSMEILEADERKLRKVRIRQLAPAVQEVSG